MSAASYEGLYNPPPLESWDPARLEVVGEAYRQAAGDGRDPEDCIRCAQQAYWDAGGRSTDRKMIVAMVASLAVHRGDRLWGPAQARVDRERPSLNEPPPEWNDGGLQQ